MRKLVLILVLIFVFNISLLFAQTNNKSKRTYVSGLRYVTNGPSREQADPLYVTVNVKFSRNIKTVGGAIKYVIARSGYHISSGNLSSKGTRLLMNLPLPHVQRRLEPMTLRQALRVLIGEAYRIKVNPISRSISFGVKPKYEKMLSAAISDFYSRNKKLVVLDKRIRKTKSKSSKVESKKQSKKKAKERKKSKAKIANNMDKRYKIINPIKSYAVRIKSPKVSINQALVAIFENNQNMFHNNNMYLLRTGAKIKMPPNNLLNKYKTDEADYMVLNHFHKLRKSYHKSMPVKTRLAKQYSE